MSLNATKEIIEKLIMDRGNNQKMNRILMTSMATLIEIIYKPLVVPYLKIKAETFEILMKIVIPLI